MQPYFFPYIGYFELIARTDRWIVFDSVQYNPKSWMNRNRILHPNEGWQYVTVPVVKTPHGTAISEMRIKDGPAALQRVLGQIDHYRKRAPFFPQVRQLLESAFAIASDRLVDLNVSALKVVCDYLGIDFRCSLYSKEHFDLADVEHPGQWALKIARSVGALEYLNPPGGKALFRQDEWDAAGIRLSFTEMPDLRYDCSPYSFIENLSIVDVLMWCEPATVAQALRCRS